MFFGAFLLASCAKERQIGDRVDLLHLETESRNDTYESCLDQRYLDIQTCIDGLIPINFELPQYPGCQFYGSVQFIFCYAPPASRLYVGDIVVSFVDNCPQYYIDLQNAQANGTLVSFHRTFMGSVYNVATEILLDTNLPVTESTVRVEHHLAACKATCWKPAQTDGTGNGDPTGGIPPTVLLVPVDTPCDDACCIRTATYQRINGGWIQSNISWDSSLVTCPLSPADCSTSLYTECSGGCDFF